MGLPSNRPLTLADFANLPQNTVIVLHYNSFNQGTFVWLHDRVEGNRVWGSFAYAGETFCKVGNYLYEFDGFVCQGSGAEPVWTKMPDGQGGIWTQTGIERNPHGSVPFHDEPEELDSSWHGENYDLLTETTF